MFDKTRLSRVTSRLQAFFVGVLVVIAIVAIIAFKGKITELWNAITTGINSL